MGLEKANLTRRDLAILDTLALRVRVLSVEQVAATWFGAAVDCRRAAERRLRTLEERGLVLGFVVAARPPLQLETPLVTWRGGQPDPDFTAVATALARRWRQPAQPTSCIVASRSAGIWLGGQGGRRPRRSEVSHDLTLAGIYLQWQRANPYAIDNWYAESRLSRLGFGKCTRLPDALVRRDGGDYAIEVGGAYPAAKLVDFHAFCCERGLSYEIW